MHHNRDVIMTVRDDRHYGKPAPTAVRKGRFLWLEPESRNSYINGLKSRIADGFYFGDTIIACIVDELAPVLNEVAERDRGGF